ncbi:hypothetical protein Tco_0958610 [Tanacetum coccineum]
MTLEEFNRFQRYKEREKRRSLKNKLFMIFSPYRILNPADQFIFQRRTPMPTEPSEHADSPSLDAKLTLTDNETESEEEVLVIKAGDQDEGQARSNPGEQDEGQAGSNPGDAVESQPQPSHVQMDEEFTTTAYPNVQENLKLLTEDQEEEPGKTNAEAEVQSMVSIPIHQDTSSVPPMTTSVSKAIDEIVTNAVDWAMQAPLRACFRDLPTIDMKEILQQQMKKHLPPPPPPPSTSTSGSTQQQGSQAPSSSKTAASASQSMAWTTSDTKYESADIPGAQELSLTDYLMQDDSIPEEQVLLSNDEDSKKDHQPKADLRKDWWKPLPEEERPVTPEPAWTIPSSNKSDVVNNWASALATTYDPPVENSLLVKNGDMTTFMNWYCQKVNKTVLTQADFKRQAYEVVKAFYPDVIHLQFQMEECHKMLTAQVDWTNPEGDQVRIDVNQPLPLGSPPGHVTIQSQFCFNKDLEYLRYGSKESNPILSISKIKAASYLDFGLELLKFYIDRHDSLSRRKDVRTHMRILSVVRIKAYSRYGYDYLSKIILRRADFQEHTIAEKDFKNMYPSDFEDLNLLLLQGHLNHLPGSDKRMLSTATQLNLTKPRWDATGYEFKHDYTIIESLRAVVFLVNNNERKIMRFNEIYKFSDGMLTRILEALDYRVKEFKVKQLNPGMNTQFWTKKDVTRSKEFITTIERRLKTRRIYRNLECFIGGRVRDIEYRLLQITE